MNSAKQTQIRRTDPSQKTHYRIGDLVEHKLFGYRGVVFDLDPTFMHSDEWYERQALTQPAQQQPWYYVLVHNGVQSSYVPQAELRRTNSIEQINHPALGEYFKSFDGSRYASFQKVN